MSEWTTLEYPSGGKLIRSSWGRGVVDNLNYLYERKAPFYQGYLYGDIIPDKDLFYVIGHPDARLKQVHVGHGYFIYDTYVSGKSFLDLEARVRKLETVKAPFYEGYLYGDIIPSVDKFYDIGKPDAKIRTIHSEYGYFTYTYTKTLSVGDIFFGMGWRMFEKKDGIYLEKVPEGHVYKILLERVK